MVSDRNTLPVRRRSAYRAFLDVLLALILRELRTRFGSMRLGVFWIFLEPVLHVALLMYMLIVIRGREFSEIDFSVFLVAGLVPYLFFRSAITKIMDAINANRALFAYPAVTPFSAFVARLVVEAALYFLVFFLLAFILGFYLGKNVWIHLPLEWMVVMLVGVVFSFGFALVLCVLVDAIPAMKSVVRMIFFPLYLISGVIYPIWLIPKEYFHYVAWNPYLHIIDKIRFYHMQDYPLIAGTSVAYPACAAMLMLFAGTSLYVIRRRHLMAL